MMKGWDIERIMPLILEAGRISVDYWKRDGIETEFKADASPVTIADKAVESMLAREFDHPDNGVYLIGEESVETRSTAEQEAIRTADTVWIVDPIDGTAPYAAKLPMFGTCIGLMERGKIVHGAMFMPLFGELYITEGDTVLMTRCHDLSKPFTRDELEPLVTIAPTERLIATSQLICKRGHYYGKERVQTLCSCVYAIGNLLRGRYAANISAGKIWDFAPGIAMLDRLGGYGRMLRSGTQLTTTAEEMFLFAPGNPRHWGVKEHLILAMDRQTADDVAAQTVLDPEFN